MNAAELERKAKLARFVAELRRDLIELGIPEHRVMRMSAMTLVEVRATYTPKHLLGAPTSAKGA